MENVSLTIEPRARAEAARAAEWRLILSYAAFEARPALTALFDLDHALGDVMRSTSEPMLAQMRYTWWHDSLTRLDTGDVPAMPVLQAVASNALAFGGTGARLAALVEGWEALIEADPADSVARTAFARGRGATIFGIAARMLGQPEAALHDAGSGWALVDLSRRLTDRAAANAARTDAAAMLKRALDRRWPADLRVLGALAVQAAMDLRVPADQPLPAATLGRVARLGWHRLTGR